MSWRSLPPAAHDLVRRPPTLPCRRPRSLPTTYKLAPALELVPAPAVVVSYFGDLGVLQFRLVCICSATSVEFAAMMKAVVWSQELHLGCSVIRIDNDASRTADPTPRGAQPVKMQSIAVPTIPVDEIREAFVFYVSATIMEFYTKDDSFVFWLWTF